MPLGPNPFAYKTRSITSNYTATSDDDVIFVDAGAGGVTVTLPPATNKGQFLAITKSEGSINVVTVSRAGTDTIQGAVSVSLTLIHQKVILCADGVSKWYKLSSDLV